MTIEMTSRAEFQSTRIRLVAALRNMNLVQLHRAILDTGHDVSYEKIRRAYSGERTNETEYSLLKAIAEATDAPLEFVAGDDDVPFTEMSKGVYLTSDCGIDTDCPNYVDAEGTCVRIDHCPLIPVAVAA